MCRHLCQLLLLQQLMLVVLSPGLWVQLLAVCTGKALSVLRCLLLCSTC
jgi:hypothetical protein